MTEAARPPACPACERVARTPTRGRAESVVKLTADPAWAEAVAAAPVCLEHLVALMGVRPAPSAWAAVEERQLERLARCGTCSTGTRTRRAMTAAHRQTDAQRASPDQAAALLAGGAADGSSGGRRSVAAPRPPDARAVVLTGVVRIRQDDHRRRDRRSPGWPRASQSAAIDLDWLGWYSAPGDSTSTTTRG